MFGRKRPGSKSALMPGNLTIQNHRMIKMWANSGWIIDLPTPMTIAFNTIYCEDCVATLARMPNNFLDLTLSSPPYDDMRHYHGYPFDFPAIAHGLFRVTRPGGVVVWIVGDRAIGGNETGSSFRQALGFKEAGFNLWDTMVFEKEVRGATGNNKGYWQGFDFMFVLSKGHPKTINLLNDRANKEARSGDRGTKRLADGRLRSHQRGGYGTMGRRTNIWKYAVGKGHSTGDEIAFRHPAIFPEALARDHILSWSNPGDVVYDPFMGSGTVAKMALLLERKFIGSEVSAEYCRIAEERLRRHGWQGPEGQ